MSDLNIEEKDRLEKISILRENNHNPYPASTTSTISTNEALNLAEGKKVSVHGRLVSKRVMGKLCFNHIKDSSTRVSDTIPLLTMSVTV